MPSDLPIARRPRSAPVAVPVEARPPLARPVGDDDRPRRRSRRRRLPKLPSPTGFLVTLGVYGLLLWTMIVYMVALGIVLGVRYADYDSIPTHVLKDQEIIAGFALGGMHAFLVAAAVAATWRPDRLTNPAQPLLAWGCAAPALAAMLMVNIGFGLGLRFLVETIGGQSVETDDAAELGIKDGWIAVLLVCVQPAIVEEVFFRFLLLGHLRPHIGLHGAVWLSSFFFAMAHLGQLIAFPVLFVLGGFLAYARVYSGGLALPILLHFLHNLAVLSLGPHIDKIHFS